MSADVHVTNFTGVEFIQGVSYPPMSFEADCNRYILDATTFEGQSIEIGRSDRLFTCIEPPQVLCSLAIAIAEKSGAKLDLR